MSERPVAGPLRAGAGADAKLLRLLRTGEVAATGRVLRGSSAVSAATAVHELHSPASGARVDAVMRDAAAGGPKEVFAYAAGHAIGIDDLMAPTAMWRGERSAMQVVPGTTWYDARIYDGYGLEHALRQRRVTRQPTLALADLTRLARADRQRIQSFDHVWGNFDRHPNNGMFDAADGAVHLIDNAGIFQAHRGLREMSVTGVGARTLTRDRVRMQLLPEVVDGWRTLDRGAVATAFERMRRAEAHAGQVATPKQQLDQAFERIDAMVDAGAFTATAS
jgi:hypothetical protein